VGTDAGTSPPRGWLAGDPTVALYRQRRALINRTLAGSAALRHLDDPLSYAARQAEKARLLRT
jgi:hypothetical protein